MGESSRFGTARVSSIVLTRLPESSVEPPARGPSPTSQMVTGAVGNALGVAADLAKRSAQAFKEQLGKAHQMITAQKREMKTMGRFRET